MAGLVCLAIPFHSYNLARADWLRRHPNAGAVAEAIRLDPANSYAYTLRAEILAQQGRTVEAERNWSEALTLSPRDAESWIRLALLKEQGGNSSAAEKALLQGARISQTWLPRWALASFYFRQHRASDFRRWAREALLRASDDVGGLFALLDEARLSSEVLPRNRRVLAAWLNYRLAHPEDGIVAAAAALAGTIPESAPAWPGLDDFPWSQKGHPAEDVERAALLNAVDRLRESGEFASAEGLWNQMCERRIVAGEAWSAETPIGNPQFRFPIQDAGFDWRIANSQGAGITADPQTRSLTVRLDGSQREQVSSLVSEPVIVPAGRAYQFVVESRSDELPESNGLLWEIREPSSVLCTVPVRASVDWRRWSGMLPGGLRTRTMQVTLSYARVPGTVRAEGSVEFRRVALERTP